MSKLHVDSWPARVLRRLAGAVYSYPKFFVFPQLVLFGLAVWYTIGHLQFDMNRNNLVGSHQHYQKIFLRFLKEFPDQNDLVTLVQSENMEKNRQFVERLGRRLEQETNLFTDVFYKGDLRMMGRKALLFVTNDTTLTDMLERLREARPMLANFEHITNLYSLLHLVNRSFYRAGFGGNTNNLDSMMQMLPALTRILNQAAEAIHRPGIPPSPGVSALFDGGEQAEQSLYITFDSNRVYLVTARAASDAVTTQAVKRLKQLVAQTRAEVPGVNAGCTGEPVLDTDEMAQSKRDTTQATIISLVLCSLLFIYAYRETGRPLKAVFSLIIGLGYTMGYATLAIGHLNILTVTFMPMLIGLAIDFGIHLVTRFEEEMRRGRPEREAMEKAMVNTGLGIFTGCFTTAGAFLAMGFTHFKGIQEMGEISGGGLLLCLVPMMTLLPVLLLRGRQNTLDHAAPPSVDHRARIERLWLERPGLVISITVVITLLAIWQIPRVYFDYDLLHLQEKGLPAVEYEAKLIHDTPRSVLFGAVVANSLAQAEEYEKRIVKLPAVASVESMADFLAANQTQKLQLVRRIKAELAGLRFSELDPDPVDLDRLHLAIQTLDAYAGLGATSAAKGGEPHIAKELRGLHAAALRLRQAINNVVASEAIRKLTEFQHALFTDLRGTFEAIKNQDDSSPLRVQDLPPALRHRFIGVSGHRYLLQVFPKKDIWKHENQLEFVRELRTVDPDVTGTPVQLLEYTSLLKDSYIEAAGYALGAIVILLFIHFRSLLCVVLALVPVALGSIWMLGWMGLTGMPFNPANIMTLPLVVGIGVTNGVHILNRFAEEASPAILARSTGKAVLVSALTTVAGFGSLIPAKHQGISSLGVLMAGGTSTCMIAALTFLPTVLNWATRRGWRFLK